jgi:flagellar hook-associated protein 1 FlgK
MVTLFGIFEVGSRGLLAQQLGLNVTGNNIANANTDGYSRQRVNLTTEDPINSTSGVISTGVRVDSIQRLRDEFLDFQIRATTSESGFLGKNSSIYDEIQTILQDPLNSVAPVQEDNPAEAGLSSLLIRFFGSFQELAANPESTAVRATVRESAITLANGFNTIRASLGDLSSRLNQEVPKTVQKINGLLDQIASINEQIVRIESDSANSANDLRDKRDQLITNLATLVPVTSVEQPNGQVDIRVLGSGVVTGNRVSHLEAVTDPQDPTGTYQIVNSVERSRILTGDIKTGQLGALIQGRDNIVQEFIGRIDSLAQTVIQEVNRIQSESIGLDSFTDLTGTAAVADPSQAIDTQTLDFPPQAGSFVVRVVNAQGVAQNLFTVNFDPSVDTLDDLAARIDAIDGAAGAGNGAISATVTSGNQLNITGNGGLSFTFQGDTSNVISALGLNNFFSGKDAGDIAVSSFIQDPASGLRRIAASSTGAPGDNGGALAIAALTSAQVADGGTTTISDSYRRAIGDLGSAAQRNTSVADGTNRTLIQLVTRQESVSGVSLDEESVNLIRFQHAFNAAARYITTVDSLIDRVVNGLGVTR